MNPNVSKCILDPFLPFKVINIVWNTLTMLITLHQNNRMHKWKHKFRKRNIFPSTEIVNKAAQMGGFPCKVNLRHHENCKLLYIFIQSQPPQCRNETWNFCYQINNNKIHPNWFTNTRMSNFYCYHNRLNLLTRVLRFQRSSMHLSNTSRCYR